ncbi:MAG: metallophosphoesterase [Nitrospiraceae bacterium]
MPEDAEIITGVIYGDTHGQFIDEEAEAILHGILLDFQPHVVVHVGDAVDCYSISKFDKDPNRKESLQDEIDHARRHLARTRAMVPSSAFFLLEGNHEDRLRRAIWGSSGPQREVLKLREVQKAMTWPTLLQTDQLGIEFVSTFEQPKRDIFPKFLVKHGEVVRKWGGTTAQGEYLKYGKSGASGHIHRLATFMHRDHNGNHMWAESGCLCGLDPAYMRDPDWQQGLLVVSFERETGAFQVEPIYIHRGLAIWRGKAYRA